MRPDHVHGQDAFAPGPRHHHARESAPPPRADHSWRSNATRLGRARPPPPQPPMAPFSRSEHGSVTHSWNRYPGGRDGSDDRGRADMSDRKRRREYASPSSPPYSRGRYDRSSRSSFHQQSQHHYSNNDARVAPRKHAGDMFVRGMADRVRHAPSSRWHNARDNARPPNRRSWISSEAKAPPGQGFVRPPPPGPPPAPFRGKARLKEAENEDKQEGSKNAIKESAEPESSSECAAAISPPFLDDAYEIMAQVGEGTYGQVYKASAGRSGRLVALKKIRMDHAREGFPVTSMREMKLLQALRHENVIRMHETMTSRAGSVYMVFEYMEHDLNGILVHPDVSFTPAHIKSLTEQLLRGLAYLHERGVLHRDLKGSNLLLNSQGTLKIADFGLARTFYKHKAGDYTNRVVTLWYRPPELLLGATHYGAEVDSWGAGCLFLELFKQQAVFQGRDEIHQLHVITRLLGPITLQTWPGVQRLPWYELLRLEEPSDVHAPMNDTPDQSHGTFVQDFGSLLTQGATSLVRGLLAYDPRARLHPREALQSAYFVSEEPPPDPPGQLLASLGGEWHEMQSKQALRHAQHHPKP